MRRPLRLQEFQLRRDMRRQDLTQRAEGRLGRPLLTVTLVPPWASKLQFAEGGSKAQRMVALYSPWSMATRTGSVPLEMVGELLTYQVLLQSTEDRFRLLEA